MGRWQRYWFPVGGRANAAAARIAVAATTWMTLGHLRDAPLIAHPERAVDAAYHPVGILLLTFGHVPAPELVDVAMVIAQVAAIALLVGAFTRTAAALALLGTWFASCYAVSFQPTWGHDNTLPCLALIAMQGTRGGDVLGFDGWWRRRRGLPAPPANAYEWNVRLVQLFAGIAFLSAGIWKLGASHFTLRWALSDNLRHHILAEFDLNHKPRTEIAEWLLQSPWHWRTAAMLNMVNQFVPILGAIFVRSRLRFIAGLCFLGEVLGIGLVMNLWEWPWLPVAAVFVDWDRLIAWVRKTPPATPAPAPAPMRRASRFIAAVVVYDVIIAFTYPRIDQRMRTYPFTAFPMFSIVRARPPYDSHQDYAFIQSRFKILADDPAAVTAIQTMLHRDFIYRRIYRIVDPELVRERLGSILRDLPKRYPGVAVHGIELWATIYHVPAYPAPARLEPHDVALMGALAADGTWTTGMGRLARKGVNATLTAVPPAVERGPELTAYVDGALVPQAIPVARDGDRWTFTLPRGDVVLLVSHLPDGRPVLVARYASRAWW